MSATACSSRSLRVVAGVLAGLAHAGSSATAQTHITSPRGLEAREGNAAFFYWGADRRFQQLDRTQDSPILIGALAWRRDGLGGGVLGARTLDLEVEMGSAASWIEIHADWNRNYRNGQSTVVKARARVNMPDWLHPAPVSPAPFDFAVPLDLAYAHQGRDPLVIELAAAQASLTANARTDTEYGQPAWGQTTESTTGCLVVGRSYPFWHYARLENSGPSLPNTGMRLWCAGESGPATVPVMLFVDSRDPNLVVPGACAPLRAGPALVLPLGPTNAAGDVPGRAWQFPYDVRLQGMVLFTQLLAHDLGQSGLPLALSNGLRLTMPATHPTVAHDCIYLFGAEFAEGVFAGGGMVMRLR